MRPLSSIRRALAEARSSLGDRSSLATKRRRWVQTFAGFFDRSEQRRRLAALQRAGGLQALPSRSQLRVGTVEMMVLYVLPGSLYLYASTGKSFVWQQVLRLLDEPSAVLDPVGLSAPKESIIAHLLQVTHHEVGYDIELLHMFPDGIEDLRAEVQLLIAGAHPRQEAIDRIVEEPGYHAALLACLDRHRDGFPPGAPLQILPPPPGSEKLYAGHHEECLSAPTRFLRYCATLPPTPVGCTLHLGRRIWTRWVTA